MKISKYLYPIINYISNNKITKSNADDYYLDVNLLQRIIKNREELQDFLSVACPAEVKRSIEYEMRKYVILINWKHETDYLIAISVIEYMDRLNENCELKDAYFNLQIAIFGWLILPVLTHYNEVVQVSYFNKLQYECSKSDDFYITDDSRLHVLINCDYFISRIFKSNSFISGSKSFLDNIVLPIGNYGSIISNLFKYGILGSRKHVLMILSIDTDPLNDFLNYIYVFNPMRCFYPIFNPKTAQLAVTFIDSYNTIWIDWDKNKSVFEYRDLFMNSYQFSNPSDIGNISEDVDSITKISPKMKTESNFKFPIFKVLTKSQKKIYVIPRLYNEKEYEEFDKVKDFVRFM